MLNWINIFKNGIKNYEPNNIKIIYNLGEKQILVSYHFQIIKSEAIPQLLIKRKIKKLKLFYYLRSSAFLVLITDGVCIFTKYIPDG